MNHERVRHCRYLWAGRGLWAAVSVCGFASFVMGDELTVHNLSGTNYILGWGTNTYSMPEGQSWVSTGQSGVDLVGVVGDWESGWTWGTLVVDVAGEAVLVDGGQGLWWVFGRGFLVGATFSVGAATLFLLRRMGQVASD